MNKNGYLELDSKRIKKMLANHNAYMININNQRINFLTQIHSIEEDLQAIVYKGYSYTEPTSRTNRVSDPVFDSFLKFQEGKYKEKILECQNVISNLNKEEAALDRVCSAFHRTITLCPIGYRIAFELCYRTDKKYTWVSIAADIGKSKTYVSQAIDATLKLVKFLYDLDVPTSELITIQECKLRSLIETRDNKLLSLCEKF